MTKAIVKVLLEIKVDNVWDDECTLAQVRKQAKDQANSIIVKMFEDHEELELIAEIQCVEIII